MGLEAQLRWLDGALVPAGKLIRDQLIPIAHDGLLKHDVSRKDADHYLDIIDQRVGNGQTGAQWQLRVLDELRGDATPARHVEELTEAYLEHQQSGHPVHTWAASGKKRVPSNHEHGLRVEQYMTTDLFTVNEAAQIDLAASVMGWRHIRHILVEDEAQHLVGIVSLRDLLVLYASEGVAARVAVDAVMTRDPVTIAPEASMREALGLMRAHKIGALPVVRDRRLVGILTEHDFIDVAARYL
jgi:CBS domain-containing protein